MLLLEFDGDVITTREKTFSINDKNKCRLTKELADYWKKSKRRFFLYSAVAIRVHRLSTKKKIAR